MYVCTVTFIHFHLTISYFICANVVIDDANILSRKLMNSYCSQERNNISLISTVIASKIL